MLARYLWLPSQAPSWWTPYQYVRELIRLCRRSSNERTHTSALTFPSGCLGAGFKRTAKYFKATVTELVERPFAFVKHQMVRRLFPALIFTLNKFERPPGVWQRRLIIYSRATRRIDRTPEFEHMVKWSASSLYTGGAETVSLRVAVIRMKD